MKAVFEFTAPGECRTCPLFQWVDYGDDSEYDERPYCVGMKSEIDKYTCVYKSRAPRCPLIIHDGHSCSNHRKPA
ncbi:MAG: hypothetical protein FWE32_03630 [Oscillospiraceae bacterium]|nr:hypothetical protein [Oscillospiraceae bacterium]